MSPAQDCADVLEKLPLHVGGDVDPEVQAALERHLERCPGCRGHARRAAAAREALRFTFEHEVRGGGPNLWPGIRTALVREGRIRPARLAPAGPWRPVAATLAAAAALAAALIGPALLRGSAPGPDPSTNAPMAAPIVAAGVSDPLALPGAAIPSVPTEDSAAGDPSPRASGLVPIRSAADRLATQVGPDLGTNTLTSTVR